jgi:hypothetical protein
VTRPEQIETVNCSPVAIMRHPHFARGLADVRAGRPFDPDIVDDYWAYERGRQFGTLAPPSMPLLNGKGAINPKAALLFATAIKRRLIT